MKRKNHTKLKLGSSGRFNGFLKFVVFWMLSAPCVLVPISPSRADVFTYAGTGTERTINCGILLADSAGQNHPAANASFGFSNAAPYNDIIAPYVFYILGERNDVLPAGWTLVNPNAPSSITSDILNRFQTTPATTSSVYTLGEQVSPNMAAYWEVSLTDAAASYAAGINPLSQYDILLIHTHEIIGLSRFERELLRQYVDQGGTLWFEDSGNATTQAGGGPGGLFADVQFQDAGGANGFAFVGDQYHHNPLVTQPYFLSTTELNDLGDKFIGTYNMSSMSGSNMPPDPYLLTSVVGNTGFQDMSGNNMPYISAGTYGAGHIIIDNADVADAVNNPVDPNSGTPTETGICPTNLQASRPNDLKFMVNMIAWSSNTAATDQANVRRGGSQPNALVGSGALSKSWIYPDPRFNGTINPVISNAPVQITQTFGTAISGNIVYTTADVKNASGSAVPTLSAFDLIPSEDLTQTGRADNGLIGSSDPYTGMPYTNDYNAGTSYDQLWSVQPQAMTAQLSAPMVAALPVGKVGSKGYFDSVFVEDDNGNIYIYDAASNSSGVPSVIPVQTSIIPSSNTFSSENVPVPTPIYYHGWLIAAMPEDTNGNPRLMIDYLPLDTNPLNLAKKTYLMLDNGPGTLGTGDKSPIIGNPAIGFIPSNDSQYGGSDLVCYVATRQAVYSVMLGARDETLLSSITPTNLNDKITTQDSTGSSLPYENVSNVTNPPEDATMSGGFPEMAYNVENPAWPSGPGFLGVMPIPLSAGAPTGMTIQVSGSPTLPLYADYDLIFDQNPTDTVCATRHTLDVYPGSGAQQISSATSQTPIVPAYSATNAPLVGTQGVALGPDNALYVTVNEGAGLGYIEKILDQDPSIGSTISPWRFTLDNVSAVDSGDNISYAFQGYRFIGAPVVDNNFVYALAYNSTTNMADVLCFNPTPIIKANLPYFPPSQFSQTDENGDSYGISGNNYQILDQELRIIQFTNFNSTTPSAVLQVPALTAPNPLLESGGGAGVQTVGLVTGASGQPLLNWFAGPFTVPAGEVPSPLRRIGTQLYFAAGTVTAGASSGQTQMNFVTVNPPASATILASNRQIWNSPKNLAFFGPNPSEQIDAGYVTKGLQASGSSVIAMGTAPTPAIAGVNGGIEAIANQLTMVADNDRLIEMDANGDATWVLDATIQPIIAGTSSGTLDYDKFLTTSSGATFSTTNVSLSRPTSLTELDQDDILFADSGNSRCVQVDRQGHVLWELTSFSDPNGLLQSGASLTINHPSSVIVWTEQYVDTYGPDVAKYGGPGQTNASGQVFHYLISDSGNSRILLVDDVYVNGQIAEFHVLRWQSTTLDHQNRQYRYVYADRFFGSEPGGGTVKPFIVAAVANKRIAPIIDGPTSSPIGPGGIPTPQLDTPLKDGPGSSVVFLEFDPILSYDSSNGYKAAPPVNLYWQGLTLGMGTNPLPVGYTDGLPVYLLNSVVYGNLALPNSLVTLPLRNLRQLTSYVPVNATVPNILIADDDGVFDGQATLYDATTSATAPAILLASKSFNLELNATTGISTNFSFIQSDYIASEACTLNTMGATTFTNPPTFAPVGVQHLHNGDYLIVNAGVSGNSLQPQPTGLTGNGLKSSASFAGNVFAVTGAKALDGSIPVFGRYLPPSTYTNVVLTGPSNAGTLTGPSSAIPSD